MGLKSAPCEGLLNFTRELHGPLAGSVQAMLSFEFETKLRHVCVVHPFAI